MTDESDGVTIVAEAIQSCSRTRLTPMPFCFCVRWSLLTVASTTSCVVNRCEIHGGRVGVPILRFSNGITLNAPLKVSARSNTRPRRVGVFGWVLNNDGEVVLSN